MLVLSRSRDESIIIGDSVVVTIVDIRGEKVKIGIEAPQETSVHRREVYEAIRRENIDRPVKELLEIRKRVLERALVAVNEELQKAG